MNKFKYEISLYIKKMQIKTYWRSLVNPGMKTNSGEEAGKGGCCCWWCTRGLPPWIMIMEVSQK